MQQFTILTPNLNGMPYLEECIESVKNQNQNCIHVIKDSASTDGSLELIKKKIAEGNQIELWEGRDQGLSNALNAIKSKVATEYFGWLNSDDKYEPNILSQVAEIFARTQADIVYGDTFLIGHSGLKSRLWCAHDFSRRVLLGFGPFFGSCSVFMRTSTMYSIMFDERLKRAMDWDLWIRACEKNKKFVYFPKPLGCFRIHTGQITHVPESKDTHDFDLLMKKYPNLQLRHPKVQRRIWIRLIHLLLKIRGNGLWREIHFEIGKP